MPGKITGLVTSRAGHPLAGVCVEAGKLGGRFGAQFYGATTSASGHYIIKVRVLGSYKVAFVAACGSKGNYAPQVWPGAATASRAKEIAIKPGSLVSKIDATLGVGAKMTGRVRLGSSSGTPLGGICVQAGGLGGQWMFGGDAITDATGRFMMPSLGTGKYIVEFSSGCGRGAAYAPKEFTEPVAVTDGAVTRGIDTFLVRDGTLAGTVTNSDGRPLASICIFVQGINVADGGGAQTSRAGRYKITRMSPGLYDVEFSSCNNQGNYLPSDATASVASSQTTSLDAVLPTAGIMTGKVTGSAGRPVAGVCVDAEGTSYGGFFTRTAADGSYTLRQLEPDSYDLEFSGGCGSHGSLAPQFYRGNPGPLAPTKVPVSEGQVVTGIDAAMQPGATVAGHVTSTWGAPLSGICVTAFNDGPFYGSDARSRSGVYQIRNLAPGQYRVSFSCGAGSYAGQWYRGHAAWEDADLLSVPAGVTSGVDAVLPAAGTITGSVRDAAGQALRRVCVSLVNARSQLVDLVTTSKKGSYRLRGLPSGRYQVEFTTSQANGYRCSGTPYAAQWYPGRAQQIAAGHITVRAGHTTPGIDAVLSHGSTITGIVSYGTQGRPVSRVCVYAYNGLDNAAFAVSDRDGRFALRGLNTGSYTVDYQACANESALAMAVGRVRVTAGRNTTGVSERLRMGGTITGVLRVTARGQTSTAPGVCVEAVPVRPRGSTNYWVTGDDGNYELDNLAPGQYWVYAGDPACPFTVSGLAPQVHQGLVTVTAGQTTSGIDTLLRTPGTISGVVRGESGGQRGGPVGGICVLAEPVRPGMSRVVTVTATTGRYFVGGLRPGEYRVQFESGCGATGYPARWYPGVRDERRATVVDVSAAGNRAGINVTLPHR